MQVHRQQPISAGGFNGVQKEPRGNGHPGFVLAVLPGIAIVGHDHRYRVRRSSARRVDQQQQLDDVVRGRIRRLNDEDVLVADVFLVLDVNLAIGKGLDDHITQRNGKFV